MTGHTTTDRLRLGENTPGYGQYCPMARAVEVLGERWSLLILRDLILGTTRFNDLARGLPGLSRTLLSKRLRQLEQAGIVERLDGEYLLTPAGQDLDEVVLALGTWGAKWAFGDPDPDELDPELLVWWMHSRIDASVLPDRRFVLHVRFTDDRRRFWIVIDSAGPSVCTADPGFEVDATISADMTSLYQVWLGREPLRQALRTGRVEFEGPAAIVRRLPDALMLSPVAGLTMAATGN